METKKNKSKPQNLNPQIAETLKILQRDHTDFREAVVNIKDVVQRIETHSQNMAEVLKGFREDNKEHLELLKESYQNNTQHLQIIAGKKQVPISIFAIVVVLLCALLVASEVRYSGLDVEITTNGIHVDRGHDSQTTK